MPLQSDIRSILAKGSSLLGTPSQVVLADGGVVNGFAGIATMNDTVLGVNGQQINGNEKTLRFLTNDVPQLISGATLTWNSTVYQVKHLQLQAQGSITKVFLVEAL